MKKIWIIANWKSNKTIPEALEWINIVGPRLSGNENLKIVICPTFSCLPELKKEIQVHNYPLLLGSQDLSPFGIGAYTGEESAGLLKELVEIAILGHSERRKNFSETDEMISKKVQEAKQNSITPLVCVQGADVPVPEGCKLVAYEPVWAIGTGNPETPEGDNKVAMILKEKYSNDLEVLCGGSVNSQNIRSFISQENISGALIGGASLDPQEFLKIIENCARV